MNYLPIINIRNMNTFGTCSFGLLGMFCLFEMPVDFGDFGARNGPGA